MSDIEETKTFIEHEEVTSLPLKFCRKFRCRLKSTQLELREIYQLFLFIVSFEMIFTIIALFMRESNTIDILLKGQLLWSFNSRMLPTMAICTVFIQYIFSYLNLISNGWGDPKSRFWCDIRIMYIQGFNTIRTSIHFVSMTIFLIFAACIVGMTELSSLLFLSVLSIISIWQLGLSELTNQYDTRIQNKANDFVSLETLQYLQTQRTIPNKTNWVPIIIAACIKTISWGFIFLYSSSELEKTPYTFLRTLIIVLVTYTFILPMICHFVYQKNLVTFCELELHRMILDVFFLLIVATFSMI